MIVNVEQKIEELSNQGCDICEHFPLMLKYGRQSEHITEMGVRSVVSTWGWVGSKPKKLVCYDIYPCPVENVIDTCVDLEIDFNFHVADTREIEIEETDLLFIDTDHTYDQIKKELELHGNKAKKFIVFHDTAWAHDMNQAIKEFMEANPHWVDEEEVMNNNGFKIIKRI
jgi:hypothetical protein